MWGYLFMGIKAFSNERAFSYGGMRDIYGRGGI